MTTKFWRNNAAIWAAIGFVFYLIVCFGGCNEAKAATCLSGDTDNNGVINIGDAVAIIGYIFGSEPIQFCWQRDYPDSVVWRDCTPRIVEYISKDTSWNTMMIGRTIFHRGHSPIKKHTHVFICWSDVRADTVRRNEWVLQETGNMQ